MYGKAREWGFSIQRLEVLDGFFLQKLDAASKTTLNCFLALFRMGLFDCSRRKGRGEGCQERHPS